MSRRHLAFIVLLPGLTLWAADPSAPSSPKAEQIIRDYLAMPFPKEDPRGQASVPRHEVLRKIVGEPGAVGAIDTALKKATDARQRAELVEILREFRTPESAAIIVRTMQDPDAKVRGNAICALRILAARVDRMGPRFRGDPHEPAVPGLLPHLIAAAGDASETNRKFALYSLADSRDPQAAAEIERHLKDPSPNVRLDAACLLTEFNNAAGLPELKLALRSLKRGSHEQGLEYWTAEHVLHAMQRITGKDFGPIPMNPTLSSDSRKAAQYERRYRELIDAWVAWWDWQPPPPTASSTEEDEEHRGTSSNK